MLPSEVIRELAGAQVQNMLSLWAQSLLSALLFFFGGWLWEITVMCFWNKQPTAVSKKKKILLLRGKKERKVWCGVPVFRSWLLSSTEDMLGEHFTLLSRAKEVLNNPTES